MLFSRVLLSALLVVFGWAATSSGLDRLSRDLPGLERLVPELFRAQADRSAAETQLVRTDNDAALARAKAAVAEDPIDPDATPLLGSAYAQLGRDTDAENAFRIAARFGWRNIATQAFWYDLALRSGDFKVAAERADALLRVHPILADQPDFLKSLESEAAGRQVLAQRLQAKPPWLTNYLNVDDDTPEDVIERRLSVFGEMDSRRHPMGCDEVAPFTRVLIHDGRRHDAETLWNANCPSLKVSGLLADPSFTRVLNPSAKDPFSWSVMSSGDLSISQISDSHGPRGLVISNFAPGIRLALTQTVAFPAGVYKFSATRTANQSSTGGKLYISWGCDSRPPFPDTTAGDLVSAGQTIRVSDCDRQQIGLWLSGEGQPVQLQSISLAKVG